jgi:intein/homing endonuclease
MPIHRIFNKYFFKKWSSDMAYILGFLFADGNIIRTKRGTHFVSIYTADKALLISMIISMGSTHKISKCVGKNGNVYKVQIGSLELFNDLTSLGLVPRKARRMKLPEIPKKYIGDFVRGYFDGDGCVWSGLIHKHRDKKTRVLLVSFVSASYNFLNKLHKLLKTSGMCGGSLFRSNNGCYARLSFSTCDSLKMYKIMYNSHGKLFLQRKKLIFDKFIKMRS